jgi:hypothetical protein
LHRGRTTWAGGRRGPAWPVPLLRRDVFQPVEGVVAGDYLAALAVEGEDGVVVAAAWKWPKAIAGEE